MKKLCLFVVLSFTLVLAACGSTDDVDTGVSEDQSDQSQSQDSSKETSSSKQEQPKKQEQKKSDQDQVKKFNANISKTFLGMRINIAEVDISKDKIKVGMNLNNTSSNKISFFPDQGSAVVGSTQLDAGMFSSDSFSQSGDLNAGVKTDGVIVFEAPDGKTLDVKNIKKVTLHLGQLMDEKTIKAVDDVVITIPVK